MSEAREPTDTTRDALHVMTAVYARMTPAQKLVRMQQLTVAMNQLALAGLRSRHPNDDESVLLFRLARIRLGNDLAELAYGRQPPTRGP
jgi:hypothetical protein